MNEHAKRHLSLIGIDRLYSLTPNRELNALAALRYRMEFGQTIFTVSGTGDRRTAPRGANPSSTTR